MILIIYLSKSKRYYTACLQIIEIEVLLNTSFTITASLKSIRIYFIKENINEKSLYTFPL